MNYRSFVESSNIDFKVNDHLIECGQDTWQIRNIAATSVGKKIIPLNEVEPKFEAAEPEFELNFSAAIVSSVIIWVITRFILDWSTFATVIAFGIFGAFIWYAFDDLGARKSMWLADKNRVANNWKIWNEMKKNPPVLYSLLLETNAGSKPLFYSFDEAQITKANNAIKRSMEKKETGDVQFKIETVNIGSEDSINNFGSSIYNQSIQR